MKKLKKAFSLTIAFALSLALAVPAFADASYDFSNTISFDGEEGSVYNANYSANGYTDPTAENVNFSVAPVGVARIRWVSSWRICEFTAYVFDQDCLVTRKDGLPLTGVTVMAFDDGNYGLINSPHYWPYEWIKSATLFADDDSGCAYNFSTSDDVGSPYMISKKSIDTVFPFDNEYGHTGTLLEYRPLSAQPATPEQPADPGIKVENIPASGTAVASTQAVEVDGKKVEFQMYALLDANGNGTNYVKLRDMAHVLNGTAAQFSVGYSAEAGITVTSGQAYQDNGSEMNTPFSGDRAYTGGGQSVQINGKAVEMTAINLLDDQGGGYNYFKLRDLGAALGFNVGWSADRGVYVETDKPYQG